MNVDELNEARESRASAAASGPVTSSVSDWWRRVCAALPIRLALATVAAVWLLGCVWSFQEQSQFAAAKGFELPHLLPLVIDGFAVSMATVAWAASLDARPAVAARLATLAAVAASSGSNGVWAWLRTEHDAVTVTIAVAVPVAANLAFEVLLAELRRQVQRRRGLPAPVAVAYPRVIRLVLAPWSTFTAWRRQVLILTDPTTRPALTQRDGTAAARPATTELVAAAGDRSGQGVPFVSEGVQAGVQPSSVGHHAMIELDTSAAERDHGGDLEVYQPASNDARRPGTRPAFSPSDRALAMAELHRARSGDFPSVRELAALAEVSRGTANTALKQLRDDPPSLHLVADDTEQEPSA